MAYDMSLHTFERLSVLTRQHTHAPKKALPESTGCRVTNLATRMSEHSIIKFHVCSKQVQKDSSPEDEEEEQASPLPLCVRTTERCCWHQDVGRGGVEGHLQEDEGGGSPEGGRVLEGPAVQPRG
jgi:hypothetical protein